MASKIGAKALRLILILPVLGFWLVAYPDRSLACSCLEPDSPSEALAEADAVFLGRAVSVSEVDDGRTFRNTVITEFNVATVWKGPVKPTVQISSEADGAACGYYFAEGVEYVVYAYGGSALRTGLCSRTAPLSRALDDLTELGEGQAPPEPVSTPTPQPTNTQTPRPTNTSTPQPTDTPDLPATSGGCGQSPHSVDISYLGFVAGLTLFSLRKRLDLPAENSRRERVILRYNGAKEQASSSRPTASPSTHGATSTSPRSRTPSAGRAWTHPESSAACPSTAACEGLQAPTVILSGAERPRGAVEESQTSVGCGSRLQRVATRRGAGAVTECLRILDSARNDSGDGPRGRWEVESRR